MLWFMKKNKDSTCQKKLKNSTKRSVSPPYYRKDHENEEFEQKVQNFEPPIHYVVEQKATT